MKKTLHQWECSICLTCKSHLGQYVLFGWSSVNKTFESHPLTRQKESCWHQLGPKQNNVLTMTLRWLRNSAPGGGKHPMNSRVSTILLVVYRISQPSTVTLAQHHPTLVGGFNPFWKIWVRQLGLVFPIFLEKNMIQSTNQNIFPSICGASVHQSQHLRVIEVGGRLVAHVMLKRSDPWP